MPTFESRHEVIIINEAEDEGEAKLMAEQALDQVSFDHSFVEWVR